MRIRFLSDQIYETGGPGKGPSFAAGSTLDEAGVAMALGLRSEPSPQWIEGFLNRWLQRGVAVDADAFAETPHLAKDTQQDDKKVDLTGLTRPELDALAAERGVDISEAKNKADVIAALELAAESSQSE